MIIPSSHIHFTNRNCNRFAIYWNSRLVLFATDISALFSTAMEKRWWSDGEAMEKLKIHINRSSNYACNWMQTRGRYDRRQPAVLSWVVACLPRAVTQFNWYTGSNRNRRLWKPTRRMPRVPKMVRWTMKWRNRFKNLLETKLRSSRTC